MKITCINKIKLTQILFTFRPSVEVKFFATPNNYNCKEIFPYNKKG